MNLPPEITVGVLGGAGGVVEAAVATSAVTAKAAVTWGDAAAIAVDTTAAATITGATTVAGAILTARSGAGVGGRPTRRSSKTAGEMIGGRIAGAVTRRRDRNPRQRPCRRLAPLRRHPHPQASPQRKRKKFPESEPNQILLYNNYSGDTAPAC